MNIWTRITVVGAFLGGMIALFAFSAKAVNFVKPFAGSTIGTLALIGMGFLALWFVIDVLRDKLTWKDIFPVLGLVILFFLMQAGSSNSFIDAKPAVVTPLVSQARPLCQANVDDCVDGREYDWEFPNTTNGVVSSNGDTFVYVLARVINPTQIRLYAEEVINYTDASGNPAPEIIEVKADNCPMPEFKGSNWVLFNNWTSGLPQMTTSESPITVCYRFFTGPMMTEGSRTLKFYVYANGGEEPTHKLKAGELVITHPAPAPSTSPTPVGGVIELSLTPSTTVTTTAPSP